MSPRPEPAVIVTAKIHLVCDRRSMAFTIPRPRVSVPTPKLISNIRCVYSWASGSGTAPIGYG